jgi:RimJ/RimL family protein N-acetyltransferase
MLKKYFLKGHSIELRIPTEKDVAESGWHNWYNDSEVTKYNQHGIYPVTLDQELEIVRKIISDKSNILLSIYDSSSDLLIGNITLQNIDHFNKRSKLAITLGEEHSMTAGIEAMGLMTHHAFMKLNLERIEEGTHEKLSGFVDMLSIFGYKKEGIARNYFYKDDKWQNKIYYAALRKDFMNSLKKRDGHLLFKDKNTLKKEMLNCISR